ncbi:MAG: hypothetical protein NC342_08855 [Pseudoflavonifractor sp.]|nr:hypothetical protein [Alloprevotella sp.]MCM1117630.1 hypothetical protein [Pseudoflavonifractor sp.]
MGKETITKGRRFRANISLDPETWTWLGTVASRMGEGVSIAGAAGAMVRAMKELSRSPEVTSMPDDIAPIGEEVGRMFAAYSAAEPEPWRTFTNTTADI